MAKRQTSVMVTDVTRQEETCVILQGKLMRGRVAVGDTLENYKRGTRYEVVAPLKTKIDGALCQVDKIDHESPNLLFEAKLKVTQKGDTCFGDNLVSLE